jgi:hypothetical protein
MTDVMSDAPKPKRKLTWLWIILGILFMLFVAGVTVVFISFSYLRQNVSVARDISDADANKEFEAALAKFPGQQPLIRIVDGRPKFVADRVNPSPGKTLTTLHVIAFDGDDGEMARISLPFWLLRMKSGPIELGSDFQRWNGDEASFTVEDLEKAGPGIVMDAARRDGRLLVWAE